MAGRDALEAWALLRARGEGYPLIVGSSDSVALLAEQLESVDEPPAAPAPAIGSTVFPAELLDARAADSEVTAAVPETWPQDVPANTEAALLLDFQTGKPVSSAYIVLFPTSEPAAALALLRYGGWNDCPAPEQHVAALRYWRDQYGFEPICVGGDTIEGRVTRKPQTREAALKLAVEQYAYCADIVDQGVGDLATLAATLMVSDWWFFWWD